MLPGPISRRVPGAVCWLLLALATGCGAPDAAREADSLAADDAAAVGSVDVATGERLIRDYFLALAEGRGGDARALLAPGPRSDASPQAMDEAARALRSLGVRSLELEEADASRLVFAATLVAAPHPERTSEWQPGVNRRWIELVRGWRGWRIARIADAPLPAAAWTRVSVWAQVHLIDGGLSLDVPNSWVRPGEEWMWTPTSAGWPNVGVQWRDVDPDVDAEQLLSAPARVLRTAEVELPWGEGTLYTLEVPAAGDDDAVASYEQRLLVRAGERRVYDLFARARSAEESRRLYWVLRRMYTSAELMPGATLTARAARPECRGVRQVEPGSPEGRALERALIAALPPGGEGEGGGARAFESIGSISRAGAWLLVDVRFREGGEPGLFALRAVPGGYEPVGLVWSGVGDGEAQIRAALAERLPEAPPELLQCMDLGRWTR